MKFLLSLGLLLSAPALSAAAAPPRPTAQPAAQPAPPSLERQALARQFIGLTVSADQFIDLIRAQAAQGVTAGLGPNPSASDAAEAAKGFDQFMGLLGAKFRERMPNLMEAYAQVYAREFSADELRDMVAFAQSPAGRHYSAREVDLASDPPIELQMQGFQNDVWPIVNQIMKEKCAAHTAQRIAAGDKKARCPLADKSDSAAG
jgi:hypothetical protein